MARILLIGVDPDAVDLTDPALPPGLTAEIIRAGIARVLDALRAAGHAAHHLYIADSPDALAPLAAQLARDPVECVVIGGGVRLPPRNLPLFEAVLNVIAQATPTPLIALNARPEESVAAVKRVLDRRAPTPA